jgi:AraC family transcriptional regulator
MSSKRVENSLSNIDCHPEDTMSNALAFAPLLSSYKLGWTGIQVEYYRHSSCETTEICPSQHLICLAIQRPIMLEVISEQGHQASHCSEAHGIIDVYPANISRQVRWIGENEFIHCYLDPHYLSEMAYRSGYGDCGEIPLRFVQYDPLIYELGCALKRTLETPLSERLYVEALSTALCAHLLQHYALKLTNLYHRAGKLSNAQLQQVRDYINDYLDRDLGLAELAELLQMSVHHFTRSFKQSTGITPYQYVIQERIEKAKELLKKRDLAIAEICQVVGFRDQSNFTVAFRQRVGVTPKQYRQQF